MVIISSQPRSFFFFFFLKVWVFPLNNLCLVGMSPQNELVEAAASKLKWSGKLLKLKASERVVEELFNTGLDEEQTAMAFVDSHTRLKSSRKAKRH